jgi:predicted nucleic acid-binding protein
MSAEPAPEFLDTNVLVYAHDASAGDKRRLAIDLLDRVAEQHTAALSVQVLQEFYVTVTHKLPAPLPSLEAEAIVADLTKLPTHLPSGADVLAAIQLHRKHHLSFWDAMVIRSALRLGCSIVWSEDLASGQAYDGVTVKNPFVQTP